MTIQIVDLDPLYSAVGSRDVEQLEAFVERHLSTFNDNQQSRYRDQLMNIGHSGRLCHFFGMDYKDPKYTPLARAYAIFEALKTSQKGEMMKK